ncbi:hypothetical protein ON010_g7812 [Phytophthora cinnamomi]|nr:hypothetical protein ON010_g7812 [Phytophthora cinnamomi]
MQLGRWKGTAALTTKLVIRNLIMLARLHPTKHPYREKVSSEYVCSARKSFCTHNRTDFSLVIGGDGGIEVCDKSSSEASSTSVCGEAVVDCDVSCTSTSTSSKSTTTASRGLIIEAPNTNATAMQQCPTQISTSFSANGPTTAKFRVKTFTSPRA